VKRKARARFYCGDFAKDARNAPRLVPAVTKGWIVGHFMPPGIRRTNKMAVKYWEFASGQTPHGAKVETEAIECTLILKGRVKGWIDGESVELSEGQYFVVPPGGLSHFSRSLGYQP